MKKNIKEIAFFIIYALLFILSICFLYHSLKLSIKIGHATKEIKISFLLFKSVKANSKLTMWYCLGLILISIFFSVLCYLLFVFKALNLAYTSVTLNKVLLESIFMWGIMMIIATIFMLNSHSKIESITGIDFSLFVFFISSIIIWLNCLFTIVFKIKIVNDTLIFVSKSVRSMLSSLIAGVAMFNIGSLGKFPLSYVILPCIIWITYFGSGLYPILNMYEYASQNLKEEKRKELNMKFIINIIYLLFRT